MTEHENASYQVGGRKLSAKSCKPCSGKNITTSADVFCMDCQEFQCKECRKVHSNFAFMKDHKFVTAAEASESKLFVDLKGLDICDGHKKQYEFYCVREDILCCSLCAIEKHRQCKEVITLKQQAEKKKTKAVNVLTVLSKLETAASKQVKLLQETIESVGSELEALLSQIENAKEKVIKNFDDLKSHVMDKLEPSGLTMTHDLQCRLTKTKTVEESVAKSKAILATVAEHGSAEQEAIVSLLLKTLSDGHPAVLRAQMDNISRPVFALKQ